MAIEILSKIGEDITESMMRHMQFADIMDFMGCRGFKRMGEYMFYKDAIELRKLHRYAINHCNKVIVEKDVPVPDVIPTSWEGAVRQQVDENTRQKQIRKVFMESLDYEKALREKYNAYYQKMIESGYIHAADKVMHLIDENEMAIKHLERMVLEYGAVDWNMLYIMQQQKKMHDHYKDKTEELFD